MSRKPTKASAGRPRRRAAGHRRRIPRRPGWRLLAGSILVFVVVVSATLVWRPGVLDLPRPGLSGIGAPSPEPGVVVSRVIDGDTLTLANGEHVRILNIDTAEMPPRSRCAEERDLALAAKARLSDLVRDGDVITLVREGRRDRDTYGRQLRLVRIDGQDVGELLVREGLAEPWRGHKATWC